MIKAAIFDMDGLLIDSEPLWKRAHQKVFGDLGISYGDEDHVSMLGRRTNEVVAHLYKEAPWKGPSPEEVEGMITAEVILLINSEGSMMPGVHEVLALCKREGLPIAIASSSPSRVIETVVNKLEIREHFDHIYSAQFEEYGKPHPGVFLSVAEHFKVDPHECVVFEDSPNGVLAAKSARMKCVAVPAPEHRKDRFVLAADKVLDSLNEFDAELLARLG